MWLNRLGPIIWSMKFMVIFHGPMPKPLWEVALGHYLGDELFDNISIVGYTMIKKKNKNTRFLI